MNENVCVDIVMVTYNHEAYIVQAIESILMQETDFPVRIRVGEDNSTDGTAAIIKQYAVKYPGQIIPYYNTDNMGIQANSKKLLLSCDAMYIAICDGDDYWIDKHKLQKQVDFLSVNAEYSCCFTNANILVGGREQPAAIHKNGDFSIEDVLEIGYAFHTCTFVFRNIVDFSAAIPTICVDYGILLDLALKGKGKVLPDVSAVYRVHGQSVTQDKPFDIYYAQYKLLHDFNVKTSPKYDHILKPRLQPMAKQLLIYWSGILKGRKRLINIMHSFRGYIRYKTDFSMHDFLVCTGILFFPSVLKFVKMMNQRFRPI